MEHKSSNPFNALAEGDDEPPVPGESETESQMLGKYDEDLSVCGEKDQ